MRKTVHRQLPLVPALREHSHIAELEEMSRILDGNPDIAEAAHADLTFGVQVDKGAEAGLSADQVVRAAILYHENSWSYAELAFELAYHAAYRGFCRLGLEQYPSRSALQRDISRIRPQTWEKINRVLIRYARDMEIEDGKKARTDCTVTETTIHHPTDGSLLWDCVRVLTREMDYASKVVNVSYSDHRKRAKRRLFTINNARRMNQRIGPYLDLLKVTKKTLGYAKRTVGALKRSKHLSAPGHLAILQELIELTTRVIDQTERRVLQGESVPAIEKVVSIFEPHTDVIRKGGRETFYGHKICLTAGVANLITDCVILKGNPTDESLAVEMMRRHAEIFDRPPEQAAFDGGFASKDNLADLKKLGIEDVAFSKRRELTVLDMVKSSWVYKRLREFRAGIEGIISFLKRVFGLGRCRWKGLRSFEAYTWSAIVSANLLVLARHALE
jgi:IS5 family transposase